jgi:uncharacterized protein YcbK (DUF882 family)
MSFSVSGPTGSTSTFGTDEYDASQNAGFSISGGGTSMGPGTGGVSGPSSGPGGTAPTSTQGPSIADVYGGPTPDGGYQTGMQGVTGGTPGGYSSANAGPSMDGASVASLPAGYQDGSIYGGMGGGSPGYSQSSRIDGYLTGSIGREAGQADFGLTGITAPATHGPATKGPAADLTRSGSGFGGFLNAPPPSSLNAASTMRGQLNATLGGANFTTGLFDPTPMVDRTNTITAPLTPYFADMPQARDVQSKAALVPNQDRAGFQSRQADVPDPYGLNKAPNAFTPPASTGRPDLLSTKPGEIFDLDRTTKFIEEVARRNGIDPEIAVRVAKSENLNPKGWQSKVYNKNGQREPSYGPFQLLVGGKGTGYGRGLGNVFMERTGLDPRNPETLPQQIEFALEHASKNGWGSWYGAAKAGISSREGLNQPVSSRAAAYSNVARSGPPTASLYDRTAMASLPPARDDMLAARARAADPPAAYAGLTKPGTPEHQARIENTYIDPKPAARTLATYRDSLTTKVTTQTKSVDLENLSFRAQNMLANIVGANIVPELVIASGKRSATANKAAGGARGSQHLDGNAIDISTRGMTDQQRGAVLAAAINGGAKGIGLYPSGAIHADTRGTPTIWGPPGATMAERAANAPGWAQPALMAMVAGERSTPTVVSHIPSPPDRGEMIAARGGGPQPGTQVASVGGFPGLISQARAAPGPPPLPAMPPALPSQPAPPAGYAGALPPSRPDIAQLGAPINVATIPTMPEAVPLPPSRPRSDVQQAYQTNPPGPWIDTAPQRPGVFNQPTSPQQQAIVAKGVDVLAGMIPGVGLINTALALSGQGSLGSWIANNSTPVLDTNAGIGNMDGDDGREMPADPKPEKPKEAERTDRFVEKYIGGWQPSGRPTPAQRWGREARDTYRG